MVQLRIVAALLSLLTSRFGLVTARLSLLTVHLGLTDQGHRGYVVDPVGLRRELERFCLLLECVGFSTTRLGLVAAAVGDIERSLSAGFCLAAARFAFLPACLSLAAAEEHDWIVRRADIAAV